MSNNNSTLKPPHDNTLPFFTYGIFKPNQLAYSRIGKYVKKTFPEKINYRMRMRDGVPLIVPPVNNKISYPAKGYLIYFKDDSSKKAYEVISNMEHKKLYKWEVIKIGENKANVLIGINPELGSSHMEVNPGNYDGNDDPLFKEALDVVEQELSDENKRLMSVSDFFKLQMAYMLLWSSIDRYCTLKYGDGHSFKEYRKMLSEEKAFEDALKKHVGSERRVYSVQDLWEYILTPDNPLYSLNYYYTIRCNVVHKGKSTYNDSKMLKQSLKELLNIFRDVLDDTFNGAD